jgi:hypothetical protein
MVAITFRLVRLYRLDGRTIPDWFLKQVEEKVDFNTTQYKVCMRVLPVEGDLECCTDPTLLSSALRSCRVSNKPMPSLSHLMFFCRIFELLMAFDALRLRNIIQLLGILCMVIRSNLYLLLSCALQYFILPSSFSPPFKCIRRNQLWYHEMTAVRLTISITLYVQLLCCLTLLWRPRVRVVMGPALYGKESGLSWLLYLAWLPYR